MADDIVRHRLLWLELKPHLDRLAKNGPGSPHNADDLPYPGKLFTGIYPHQAGIYMMNDTGLLDTREIKVMYKQLRRC